MNDETLPESLTGNAEEMEQQLWKIYLTGIDHGKRGDYRGSLDIFVKMKKMLIRDINTDDDDNTDNSTDDSMDDDDDDDDDDHDDESEKANVKNTISGRRKSRWIGAVEGNIRLLQDDLDRTKIKTALKSTTETVFVTSPSPTAATKSKRTSNAVTSESASGSTAAQTRTRRSTTASTGTGTPTSTKEQEVVNKKEPYIQKDLFEEKLVLLKEYKKKFGHCYVPKMYKANQTLAYWVFRQRALYKDKCKGKKNRLTDERLERLRKIGFVFYVKNSEGQLQYEASKRKPKMDARWNSFMAELEEYKKKVGNCLVPKRYPPNQALSTWVFAQRQQKRNYDKPNKISTLTPEKIKLLEDIGHVWDAKSSREWREADNLRKHESTEKTWQSHFKKLVTYERKHGHTRIPKVYPINQPLSSWVFRQRAHHKRMLRGELHGLMPKRLAQLQSIGFEFAIRAPMSSPLPAVKKIDTNTELKETESDTESEVNESPGAKTSDYIAVSHSMHSRAERAARRRSRESLSASPRKLTNSAKKHAKRKDGDISEMLNDNDEDEHSSGTTNTSPTKPNASAPERRVVGKDGVDDDNEKPKASTLKSTTPAEKGAMGKRARGIDYEDEDVSGTPNASPSKLKAPARKRAKGNYDNATNGTPNASPPKPTAPPEKRAKGKYENATNEASNASPTKPTAPAEKLARGGDDENISGALNTSTLNKPTAPAEKRTKGKRDNSTSVTPDTSTLKHAASAKESARENNDKNVSDNLNSSALKPPTTKEKGAVGKDDDGNSGTLNTSSLKPNPITRAEKDDNGNSGTINTSSLKPIAPAEKSAIGKDDGVSGILNIFKLAIEKDDGMSGKRNISSLKPAAPAEKRAIEKADAASRTLKNKSVVTQEGRAPKKLRNGK